MSPTLDRDKVFVIEDNDELRLSLQWLLEGSGYQVSAYRSAEDFMAEGGPGNCGCVLLDLTLPGMNGLELMPHLPRPQFQVIMITAQGDSRTAQRARESGVWAFIPKPFDHETLLASVRGALAATAAA